MMHSAKYSTWFYRLACGLSAVLIISSCRINQHYQRPQPTSTALYRDVNTTDTNSIALLPWKQLFGDTLLQKLIEEGINNNLDLKVAIARMKQADANFRQANASFFPSLAANGSAAFQHLAPTQFGHPEVYQAYLSSSWQVGLWGKLLSARRAALAALLQSEAYKRAVQTQLVASIASNYYVLQAYDAQLEVTLRTVENRKEDVETMTLLKKSDVVTGAAVVQSEANRYSAEVTLPDLRQNIRVTENGLSVLLGRHPGPIARDSLKREQINTSLTTGVPLQLLNNRPDVQEAEQQFRYAFELTNVARTYFYPSLTITAQGGFANASLAALFSPASFFANFIGGLTQPLFNNGLNLQRLRVTKAQQEEYLANFQKTVLTAGEEVSNALSSYQAATDKIAIRGQQVMFLQKSVEFTKELLKYTANTNYTDVLTSEQNLLAAELNGINDKLQQMQASVELYRSLGGGWR